MAETTNPETDLNVDKYQISKDGDFIFDDNPDDRELTRRGCCRCGNSHHCCGKMCHGKK
ncbi:hypothetical protein Ocin01_08619, partial [Orchesella cincta]